MTNREKLKEVFGSFVHFEKALDTEWLNREYKERPPYVPHDFDVVEFFDGTYGFVVKETVICRCSYNVFGWETYWIDEQIQNNNVKHIYRGTPNPLYYIVGENYYDLRYLDIVYSDPSTLLKN